MLATKSPFSRQKNGLLLPIFSLTVLIGSLPVTPAIARDVELQVGIVQRFGEKTRDKLLLSSPNGQPLTLKFVDASGKPKSLQTPQLALEIQPQVFPQPMLEERVVLSDHATFETAEDSASQWRVKGIEVEVAQPDRWQVWAKRDVYKTPLLRRWLLFSLKAKGLSQPILDSEILTSRVKVAFTVNGDRHSPDILEIISPQNRVSVNQNGQKRVYGGSLKLQPNAYGTYTLVNNVPLEVYLRGVVPHEIGKGAPLNAAKAQTIIARTYALRNLRRFQADGYQLCANTHCQVYYGLSDTSEQADVAISSTKGQVLTYKNELVDALYSSTTGGVTARFGDVWNGAERPYLKAVIDSPQQLWDLSNRSLANETDFRQFINLKDGFNETGRNVFRWNRQGTLAELKKELQEYLKKQRHPLENFTMIQGMKIAERSPSGRVLTLNIQTDRGSLDLRKNEIRSAFSTPRSQLFYIEPVYDANKKITAYNFVGGGLGHGVGMSQYGSYNLAKLGWTPDRILAFYYPGTNIQTLNSAIVFWRDNPTAIAPKP
jgi:SpoIID/LytB domain protein